MVCRRTAAIVICGAVAAWPSGARAQGGLTGRVRYVAGVTHETPEPPESAYDLWTGVVPELSYLFVEPRWLLRTTYAFTAAVHTRNPAEIGNRIQVASSYELSRRTTLLASADASQTSISNYLVARPVLETTNVLALPSNSRILNVGVSQGLNWQASRNVVFGQALTGSYVTSLDPETEIDNYFTSLVFSLERTWKRDGLGAELRGSYTSVNTPPLAPGKFVTVTLAPRWRHDINRSLTSSVAAGASVVFSPDPGTDPLVAPFVTGSLLYSVDPSLFELSYAGTVAPNVLTGQMLRSHQVTLRASTPLSERHKVLGSTSVGYLNGSGVNLHANVPPPPDVNAVLADVEVTWLATDWMQMFARGLFLEQVQDGGTRPSVREAVTIGVQFSSRSPDGVVVPLRFPQRVDQGDAIQPSRR